ncbi:type II toxin-antitoxin system RelE family toxin [Geodermatophilus sabuli]|uniref:mRNA-degrading endonuclease RelE, toxin component of the RelBE toxin-antitoxin system n=1 Tax=Geodermatophilus sabuli TaxID=1564158 RepID=A0A285EI30_9ACTN|nr:type II toxin-antitoxin system RelE/ParE family toxin [Geodermatophilus sabuli]MBB3086662.1 mRNA-degrading endonuclease RelE of RelBE toxin-antitoxin system [Geodermatophilus sabuli]SNX97686.1 mRNA-degrading endonuclease RelE, toxin component of the RelBE toxin-antitoxin system [Geodermatophilus sabuli]
MSSSYEVHIASAAHRQLGQLPSRVAVAVVEFITAVLPENPQRLSKPLTGEFEGLRSARRGDYRVLIDIDESARTVLVVRIAHRAEVYRPPPPTP